MWYFFRLGEALSLYNEERKAYDTDLIESMIEQIPMDIQVAHAEPFWKEVAAAFKQNQWETYNQASNTSKLNPRYYNYSFIFKNWLLFFEIYFSIHVSKELCIALLFFVSIVYIRFVIEGWAQATINSNNKWLAARFFLQANHWLS